MSSSTVDTMAITRLLAMIRQNGRASNSVRYPSSPGCSGIRWGLLSTVWPVVTDVITVHRNGKIMPTAPTTRASVVARLPHEGRRRLRRAGVADGGTFGGLTGRVSVAESGIGDPPFLQSLLNDCD